VFSAGSQGSGNREGSSSFGQAEAKDQPARGGSQEQRERQYWVAA